MATRKKGRKKTSHHRKTHKKHTGSTAVKTELTRVIKSLQTIKKHV